MTVKTPAIIISSVKYGDSGKIVKCYTRDAGIKSFISKGVYSKKNKINPLLTPLNRVEIVFNDYPKSNLHYFREIRQLQPYVSVYENPVKSGIFLFISEILNNLFLGEESNPDFFQFILESLSEFDLKKNDYSDFHLWFLYRLTQFIGCYPDLKKGFPYFDLLNGISTNAISSDFCISESELENFEKLTDLDFNEDSVNQLTQIRRKSILNTLMRYFELHTANFRHPKSLEVLAVIFD